jgi:hypothetical protein
VKTPRKDVENMENEPVSYTYRFVSDGKIIKEIDQIEPSRKNEADMALVWHNINSRVLIYRYPCDENNEAVGRPVLIFDPDRYMKYSIPDFR